MKVYIYILLSISFCSCKETETLKCNLDDVIVESLSFHSNDIDTLLIYPQSINIFKNHIIIMEPKKNALYSFWNKDDFKYLFSCGFIGHGANELINPRNDYYTATDSSFFILDCNIEREVCIQKNKMKIINNNPIVIPDAINELIKVGDDKYISAGLSNIDNKEHILYNKGKYDFFGKYPDNTGEKEKRFITNYKLSAGGINKDQIWDFYLYKNLIRSYSLEGDLLSEIVIVDNYNRPKASEISRMHPCFYKIKHNQTYIAVLYNRQYDTSKLYLEDVKSELQLWSWDGILKRRINFNTPFDIYTLSEDNVLYAMNSNQPNVIYSYDFKQ